MTELHFFFLGVVLEPEGHDHQVHIPILRQQKTPTPTQCIVQDSGVVQDPQAVILHFTELRIHSMSEIWKLIQVSLL